MKITPQEREERRLHRLRASLVDEIAWDEQRLLRIDVEDCSPMAKGQWRECLLNRRNAARSLLVGLKL